EAAAAGLEQMIFVTGRHKRAIEDHFDRVPELEALLEKPEKKPLLDALMSATPSGGSFVYLRQPGALGRRPAVLCAESVVGDEPCAVILADDLIDAQPGVTAQLVETFERTNASVVAVEDVPKEETSRYGIVGATPLNDKEAKVDVIVEK